MVSTKIIQKLPRLLKPVTNEQDANAAVTLLLKTEKEDFEILLVKRANRESDVWSNQMALPGGKRDSGESNLKTTAIRETLEETGINLNQSSFLGVLKAIQSVPRRDYRILPFVVLLEKEPEIKLNNSELGSYMWIPYEKLLQSQGKSIQPKVGEVQAFIFKNAIVWGITYEILNDFTMTVEALRKH